MIARTINAQGNLSDPRNQAAELTDTVMVRP
jgi:hypothetical protein